MKKLLIVLMVCLGASAAAQSPWGAQHQTKPSLQGFDSDGYLQDHDSLIMVRCGRWTINQLMNPALHQEPRGDGKVTLYGGPGTRPNKHECHSDNKLAQEVYLARLERLRSVSHMALSPESEAIVINFELLTGTQNSIDGNFVGMQYVSSMALTAWELWFKKHKEHLRICPQTMVLYVDTLETLSE